MSIISQSAERPHERRPMTSKKEQLFSLFFCWLNYTATQPRRRKLFKGFRRAKFTERNKDCQKNRRWFERKNRPFSFGRRTPPMEGSIPRLTRAVQTVSMASTPQNVSGLAVGQRNHAPIFVGLRLCGDRSACWVLTPLSAPAWTVLTLSKLRFFGLLLKEEKTFREDV